MQNLIFFICKTQEENSFISGLVGGCLATLLGFLLTIIWELFKENTQDKTIIQALKQELLVNKDILSNNLNLIEKEFEVLKNEKSLTNTLTPLNDNLMTFLFMNIPKKIKRDLNLFEEIKNVYTIIKSVNTTISSREYYKINNNAMTNYYETIENYNKILEKQLEYLLSKINNFVSKI